MKNQGDIRKPADLEFTLEKSGGGVIFSPRIYSGVQSSKRQRRVNRAWSESDRRVPRNRKIIRGGEKNKRPLLFLYFFANYIRDHIFSPDGITSIIKTNKN